MTADSQQNGFVNGMVDYSGRPSIRFRSGFWRSAAYIIGGGIGERFAYTGVSSNLITYLTGPLGQSTAVAAANINIWSGTGLILPLLGAFAESYITRFSTIILTSLLYIVALGLLTTCVFVDWERELFLFVCLYLMALGQGVYKACALAFGADQFDDEDAHELRSRSSFFNWWCFATVAGPLAGLPLLNYVQDNIGWGIGFGIPCISMVISLVIFMLGYKSYRYRATTTKDQDKCRVPLLAAAVAAAYNTNSNTDSDSDLQLAVKTVKKLLPLCATSVAFAVTQAQPSTLFTKQGATMDRSLTPTLCIPPATLQYAIGITAILFIPIYDRILVPSFATHRRITHLQRVGTGMILSILSMLTAALVEQKRLKAATHDPLTFWWLMPQYIMYGVADVLALVGLQEFFYDQMPCGFKALGLSVFLSVLGMGQFISSLLIYIIQILTSQGGQPGWFSDDLNTARLDCFYWLLAAFNALGFLAFLYFTKYFSASKRGVDVVIVV